MSIYVTPPDGSTLKVLPCFGDLFYKLGGRDDYEDTTITGDFVFLGASPVPWRADSASRQQWEAAWKDMATWFFSNHSPHFIENWEEVLSSRFVRAATSRDTLDIDCGVHVDVSGASEVVESYLPLALHLLRTPWRIPEAVFNWAELRAAGIAPPDAFRLCYALTKEHFIGGGHCWRSTCRNNSDTGFPFSGTHFAILGPQGRIMPCPHATDEEEYPAPMRVSYHSIECWDARLRTYVSVETLARIDRFSAILVGTVYDSWRKRHLTGLDAVMYVYGNPPEFIHVGSSKEPATLEQIRAALYGEEVTQ